MHTNRRHVLTLPDDLWAQLQHLAVLDRRTIGNTVITALYEYTASRVHDLSTRSSPRGVPDVTNSAPQESPNVPGFLHRTATPSTATARSQPALGHPSSALSQKIAFPQNLIRDNYTENYGPPPANFSEYFADDGSVWWVDEVNMQAGYIGDATE